MSHPSFVSRVAILLIFSNIIFLQINIWYRSNIGQSTEYGSLAGDKESGLQHNEQSFSLHNHGAQSSFRKLMQQSNTQSDTPSNDVPLSEYKIITRPFNLAKSKTELNTKDIEMDYLFSYTPYERPPPIIVEPLPNQDINTIFPPRPHLWNGFDTFDWSVPDSAGKKLYFFPISSQAYVAKLKDAFITHDGNTIWELNGRHLFQFYNIPNTPGPLPDHLIHQNSQKHDKLIVVCQRYAHGYWHFIAEVLPTIMLIVPTFHNDPSTKLVLSSPVTNYMRYFLEKLKITEDRIVILNSGDLFYAKEMYVPTIITSPTPPREQLALVHKFFIPTPPPENKRRKVILINRGDAGVRRVVNHEDLEANLRKLIEQDEILKESYEFVVFTSAQTSTENMVRIFSEAALIIGPGGAGLVNSVWAQPGTPQIHFRNLDPNLCHWHISASLCSDSYIINAVPVPGENLQVDVEKVKRTVIKILHAKQKDKSRMSGDVTEKSSYSCDFSVPAHFLERIRKSIPSK